MSMQNFHKQLQAAPRNGGKFSILARLTQANLEQLAAYKAALDWTMW